MNAELVIKTMAELIHLEFFQHALLISILLSLLFGLLSFFVLMRRMVFLGAGIAHSAFGGVALGVLTGMNPFLTSLIFCLAVSILIGKLVRVGHVSYDTSIGIFFSFTMALGALFIAAGNAYSFDLSGYLFGSILAVKSYDLMMTSILFTAFIIFFFIFMQKLLFMTFDEPVAEVSGVPVQLLDTLLLAFLAAVIVVSIKMVGIILISALIVLPASFGQLISGHYSRVMFWSVLYALLIMTGGLFLSYWLDLPTGATIVVSGGLLYFIGLALKSALHQ